MDSQKIAEEYLDLKFNLRKFDSIFDIDQYFFNGKKFVLLYLVKHGCIAFPKDLSESMNTSTARIAGILKKLESEGLIIRKPDDSDNRKILVSLTEEGMAEGNRIYATVHKNIESIFDILGPEDSLEYIRINKKILENFVSSSVKTGGEKPLL